MVFFFRFHGTELDSSQVRRIIFWIFQRGNMLRIRHSKFLKSFLSRRGKSTFRTNEAAVENEANTHNLSLSK